MFIIKFRVFNKFIVPSFYPTSIKSHGDAGTMGKMHQEAAGKLAFHGFLQVFYHIIEDNVAFGPTIIDDDPAIQTFGSAACTLNLIKRMDKFLI